MPAKWLVHPTRGRLSFEEAPSLFEADGVMPAKAILAIIKDIKQEGEAHPFVRPSDVCPHMACRRRIVQERFGEYGVDPLKQWAMMEGTAIHLLLDTDEVEVGYPDRVEVCGCPTRGKIDLDGSNVGDVKSKAPFMIYDYKAKTTKVWKPVDEAKDWKHQLSIYNILRVKAGGKPASKGVVWRVWRGVKGENGAWQKFEFPLLTEGQLEVECGQWMRELYQALQVAKDDLEAGIKMMPPEGRKLYSEKSGYWKCKDCPLRERCERETGFSPW